MFIKRNFLIFILFTGLFYFVNSVNHKDTSLKNSTSKEFFNLPNNTPIVDINSTDEIDSDEDEENDSKETFNKNKNLSNEEIFSENEENNLVNNRNNFSLEEANEFSNKFNGSAKVFVNKNRLIRTNNKEKSNIIKNNEELKESKNGEKFEKENVPFRGVLTNILKSFINNTVNFKNKNNETEATKVLLNNSVTNNNSKASCYSKVDLIFLLDTSGSIEQIYHEHVRWALALIEGLPIEQDTVRVAAVQYAGFPLTEFALGTYPSAEDIRQHLSHINFQSGVTRTGYALRKVEAELFGSDRGAREDAKKIIVLFTDGLSIDDPLKPASQLRELKNVTIYVASVSNDGFEPEMNRIAGTSDNVFGPRDLFRLRNALIGEAELARGCIRIGARKPFVNKYRSFQNDNFFLKSDDPTLTILSAGPTHRVYQLNTNSTVNSTKLTFTNKSIESSDLADFSSAFNIEKNELEKLQNENVSKEIFKKFSENEDLSNRNLNKILFKGLNTSNLLMKFDADSEILSSEESETDVPTSLYISKLLEFEKFPQSSDINNKKSFQATSKSSQNLENGERDVFDISNDHSKSLSTTTTSLTKLETNKDKQKIEVNTVASIKKKIRTTLKPKPLAYIVPLEQKKTNIKIKNSLRNFKANNEISESQVKHTLRPITQTKPLTILQTITNKIFTSTKRIPTSTTTKSRKQFDVKNQQFTQADSVSCLIDLLFIVDSSGSVQKVYDQQKEYLEEILNRIHLDSGAQRVALLQFAGAETQKTEWMYDSFESKVQLMNAFNQVRHITGATHIGAALENALKILESRRSKANSIVILLSDGFSQDDALKSAEKLKKLNNLEFLSLSISDLSNYDYLTLITGKTENVYVGYSEAQKLRNYINQRLQCQNADEFKKQSKSLKINN